MRSRSPCSSARACASSCAYCSGLLPVRTLAANIAASVRERGAAAARLLAMRAHGLHAAVYVTGTDTGIGKTLASSALLHALRARGLRAVGMKPVASGCERTPAGWRNEDALALQAASDPRPAYADLNPYALPLPLAPELAARDAGVDVELAAIRAGARAAAGAGRRGRGRRRRRLGRAAVGHARPGRPGACAGPAGGAGGRPAPGLPQPRLSSARARSRPTAAGWSAGSATPSIPTWPAATTTSRCCSARMPAPCWGVLPHARSGRSGAHLARLPRRSRTERRPCDQRLPARGRGRTLNARLGGIGIRQSRALAHGAVPGARTDDPRIARCSRSPASPSLALAACGKDRRRARRAGRRHAAAGSRRGHACSRPAVPLQQDLVGRLAAYRSADVRARVPGVLQRRVYEEGSDVKRGPGAVPDRSGAAAGRARPGQAALAQAQANYANAQAAADARAHAGAAEVHLAVRSRQRARRRAQRRRRGAGGARPRVQTARINLGYATVRAPISGRAGKQQVTEGALVGQGDATLLTTVDQIDPLYVELLDRASPSWRRCARAQDDGTRPARGAGACCPTAAPYRASGRAGFLRRRGRSGDRRGRAARARSEPRAHACCRARS